MWLLVGLGNPGAKYEGNRHNVGFMLADEIARDYSFSSWSSKFSGELCEGTIADEKVLLLKPQTFMNESGRSVGEALRFYKIPPEKMLVMYDELDLLFAKIRIKKAGGSGGHNGIKSIDAHAGQDYWRLRIGIDHPGDKHRVSNYVLSDFNKEEKAELPIFLGQLSRAIPTFIAQGHEAMMTQVARDYLPPR